MTKERKIGREEIRTSSRVLGREDVKRFDKAAKTFSSKAGATEKTALAALVRLGTHTSKGKITKRYSK